MDIKKVTRTASGMTGSKQIVLSFAEPQTLGRMVKGTAAGAVQIVDKDSRTLPRVGDVLDASLPGLVAQSVDVAPLDSKTWQVTVSYNNSPVKYASNTPDGNKPWNLLPVVRWSNSSEQQVAELYYKEDDDPNQPTGAILLPNGRPYFDPPLVDKRGGCAHVTWNTRKSIIDAITAVEFTVNAAPVVLAPRILPADTGYIKNIIENEELTEDGEKYYSHEATVDYRPEGHAWRPVAMDYYAIIDGKLRRVQIKDGRYGYWGEDDPEAIPVPDPVYIDAVGELLTDDPLDNQIPPWVDDFPLRPPRDWTVLGWAK